MGNKSQRNSEQSVKESRQRTEDDALALQEGEKRSFLTDVTPKTPRTQVVLGCWVWTFLSEMSILPSTVPVQPGLVQACTHGGGGLAQLFSSQTLSCHIQLHHQTNMMFKALEKKKLKSNPCK